MVKNSDFLKPICCLIDQLPGYAGLKDEKSMHVFANKRICKSLAFKSQDEIIGIYDHDIAFGDIAKHAEIFKWQDQQALKYGYLESLEILKYTNGINIIHSNKTTLKDLSGNIIGIMVHNIPMKNNLLAQFGNLILQKDLQFKNIDPKLCHYTLQNLSILDRSKLPRRTDECLFYVLRGKTAKEIANFMCLSIRTIEKYLDLLKFHFNCYNKSQLIEKAINLGYLNIIPKRIIDKKLIHFLQ